MFGSQAGRVIYGLSPLFVCNESHLLSRLGITAPHRLDETEEFPIPFGVNTWVKMVRCPGWNLHSDCHRRSVQIVQLVGPPGGPGRDESLEHLKIDIPAFLEHLQSLVSQPGVLREALNRWNPCPELVYITAEVEDGLRQMLSGHAWLIPVDQSERTRDEGVGSRIDLDLRRDTVPTAPFLIGQTDPHEIRAA